MNIELVNRWADELESGKRTQIYDQFFGATPDRCCAVGVVLLMLKDEPMSPVEIESDGSFQVATDTWRSPTQAVRFFLTTCGIPDAIVGEVYGRNDGEHQSFSLIANMLRQRVAEELRFRAEVNGS